MTGCTSKAMFWIYLTVAEYFGEEMVNRVYDRLLDVCIGIPEYLTEFVTSLKQKTWLWCDKNEPLADIYNELYEKANQFALATLDGEDLEYYKKAVE